MNRCVPIYGLTVVWIVGALGTLSQSAPTPSRAIYNLTPGEGLTGGGGGPSASLGIAPGGVTGAHIANGSLVLDDFSQSAKDGLKGEIGPQGLAGPQGPEGPQGPKGDPGEGALTDGPGSGGALRGRSSGPAHPYLKLITENCRGEGLYYGEDWDTGVHSLWFTRPREDLPRLITYDGQRLPDGRTFVSVTDSNDFVRRVLLTDTGRAFFMCEERLGPDQYHNDVYHRYGVYGWSVEEGLYPVLPANSQVPFGATHLIFRPGYLILEGPTSLRIIGSWAVGFGEYGYEERVPGTVSYETAVDSSSAVSQAVPSVLQRGASSARKRDLPANRRR